MKMYSLELEILFLKQFYTILQNTADFHNILDFVIAHRHILYHILCDLPNNSDLAVQWEMCDSVYKSNLHLWNEGYGDCILHSNLEDFVYSWRPIMMDLDIDPGHLIIPFFLAALDFLLLPYLFEE